MGNDIDTQQFRWDIVVAILIAIVVAVGAVVSWWSSLAADGAGDADFEGLRALLNVEETRALGAVNAYENYRSFTLYKRFDLLGDLIADDMEEGQELDEQEYEWLGELSANAYDVATVHEMLFPNRFLTRDGGYSLSRQLNEMWADAAKEKDLQPEPKLAEADHLRSKSGWLLGTAMILAVALVFYTLVESVGTGWKYIMVIIGSLIALIGVSVALFIQLTM